MKRAEPAAVEPEDKSPLLDVPALSRHLASHGLKLDGEPWRLPGGLANLNYRVVVNGQAGVLRRPPPGELPPGSHDMVREARVLGALAPVLDFVPRPLHLCTDKSVIGVNFQIIEYRTGIILRGDDALPGTQPGALAARLSQTLVDTLGRLHGVDPASVGLGDFGKPENFYARQVHNWALRARMASADEPFGTVDRIVELLQRQHVAPRAPTLLHSDFKLDNCILQPDTHAIEAVIDWDMATRGDPLMDLATLLSYWAQPDDPPCIHQLAQMPTAQPGFMTRDEVVNAYARATGIEVGDIATYRVLALFKLGVVFLQLHLRWKVNGVGDARYAGFAQLGQDLLEWALHCAQAQRL